jgi:hypothetical protein
LAATLPSSSVSVGVGRTELGGPHHHYIRVFSASRYPAEPQSQGFFSFATEAEMNAAFTSVGKFVLKHETGLLHFIAVRGEPWFCSFAIDSL